MATPVANMEDPDSINLSKYRGLPGHAKDVEEIRRAMEDLAGVDIDLAYSSEKLVNLDNLLMHVLILENDCDPSMVENDDMSLEFIEKALTFDILFATLDYEVGELDNFMTTLDNLVNGARQKIISCGELQEWSTMIETTLHDSEESLRETKEHVLEMKMQLAKLHLSSLTLSHNEWRYNTTLGLSGDSLVSSIDLKSQIQTVEQQRILRMLEKTLARELDLEKKLMEQRDNEDDLKLKLRLTEQVAQFMEEASEAVWGRFLEAENMAEVLMGTSKELVNKLQIAVFSLSGAVQREQDLKFKLQQCGEQLNAKDMTIQKLRISNEQLISDNAEVSSLREKVKLQEQKLSDHEIRLKEAHASSQASQEHVQEMESLIESLKESNTLAEDRAESAEAKVAQLTETNLELSDELNFLRDSNEKNSKKLNIVEKQMRESELRLQHARASSEASQEQQNMLYSAIWDMETLIDELKQKVSTAESKTENTEEQRVILSKANSELKKEIEFLRARLEALESSLGQSTIEKLCYAKDINIKTSLIMDMVMQLAMERKRIQKQLHSLKEENQLLAANLQSKRINETATILLNGICSDKELLPPRTPTLCTETPDVVPKDSSSNDFQQISPP